MDMIKPDLKSLLWLAAGFLLLPKVLGKFGG